MSGRVHQLKLANFKSYEKPTNIGPFLDFTCVIGPNGSGKSNLVDAFGFVLGIQAKDLRGNSLKDLVHRKPNEPADVVDGREGSVELEFWLDGKKDRGINPTDVVDHQAGLLGDFDEESEFDDSSSSEGDDYNSEDEEEDYNTDADMKNQNENLQKSAGRNKDGKLTRNKKALTTTGKKKNLKRGRNNNLQLNDLDLEDEVFGEDEENINDLANFDQKTPGGGPSKRGNKMTKQGMNQSSTKNRRAGASRSGKKNHKIRLTRSEKLHQMLQRAGIVLAENSYATNSSSSSGELVLAGSNPVAAGPGVAAGSSSSSSSSAPQPLNMQQQTTSSSSTLTRSYHPLLFGRYINGRTGDSTYKINKKPVTTEFYQKVLEKIKILTKARNFLVFQGDVESLANRQGMELTRFFERICGSDLYQKECEALEKEKKNSEEKLRLLFSKKRQVITEKKQVEFQKQEAEKYRQLNEERSLLLKEFYLYRMNTIEVSLTKEKQKFGELKATKKEAESAYKEELKSCKQKEEQVNQLSLQIQKLTKTSAGVPAHGHLFGTTGANDQASAAAFSDLLLTENHKKLRTEKGQLERQLQDRKQQLEHCEKKKNEIEKQCDHKKQDIGSLQKHLEKVQRKIESCKLPFKSTEQEHRYKQAVKNSESSIPLAMIDEQRDLEYQLSSEQHHLQRKQADLANLKSRLTTNESQIVQFAEQVESQMEVLENLKASSAQKKTELSAVRQNLEEKWAKEKRTLNEEKRTILDGVQSGTISQRQLEREQRLFNVSKEMTQTIPGVFGRICDLCKPTNKKYRVALNVAIGFYLDAILCDTATTCKKCVMFLKAKHLEPMTFIPLRKEDLRGYKGDNASLLDPRIMQDPFLKKHVVPALQILSIGGGYKVVPGGSSSSALGPNGAGRSTFQTAFNYLLSNTIIVENLEVARKVAYEQLPKVLKRRDHGLKIVTLHGEMIKPNGNMTVNSDATQEGGTKFDIQQLQHASSRLEQIDKNVLQIVNLELAGQREKTALESDLQRLQNRITEQTMRLNRSEEDLKRKKKERDSVLRPQLDKCEKEKKEKETDIKENETKQVKIEKEIQGIVGSFFKELNDEIFVDDGEIIGGDGDYLFGLQVHSPNPNEDQDVEMVPVEELDKENIPPPGAASSKNTQHGRGGASSSSSKNSNPPSPIRDIRALDLQQKRAREKLRMEETRLQTDIENLESQLELLQASVSDGNNKGSTNANARMNSSSVISRGMANFGGGRYSANSLKQQQNVIVEEEEKLQKLTAELEKLDKEHDEFCQKKETAKAKIGELKEEKTNKEQELTEQKRQLIEKRKASAEAGKKLDGCKGKVESLQGWRSDLWRHALMDAVQIPVLQIVGTTGGQHVAGPAIIGGQNPNPNPQQKHKKKQNKKNLLLPPESSEEDQQQQQNSISLSAKQVEAIVLELNDNNLTSSGGAQQNGRAGPGASSSSSSSSAAAGGSSSSSRPAVQQNFPQIQSSAGSTKNLTVNDLEIDFQALPDDRKNLTDLDTIREQTAEYEQELEKIKQELDGLRPNLKAAQRANEVELDVKEKTKQAEEMRTRTAQLEGRITQLKEKRKQCFVKCFENVCLSINDIYADLTATYEEEDVDQHADEQMDPDDKAANRSGLLQDRKSLSHQRQFSKKRTRNQIIDEGGRAFLDLENPEWPFEGGIKYTTMAPSKRFRDMSLLSGGEKTLAALALLFAVHSYQKPPFLILDEVDAALDAYNVQSVRRFLAKTSTSSSKAPSSHQIGKNNNSQIIVISLKDKFFSKSEGLVGVYKDKLNDCSGVLTLDLRKYSSNKPRQLPPANNEDAGLFTSSAGAGGRAAGASAFLGGAGRTYSEKERPSFASSARGGLLADKKLDQRGGPGRAAAFKGQQPPVGGSAGESEVEASGEAGASNDVGRTYTNDKMEVD
ncbi:unnamed protein product [Amoebophrya sp. A120]|nr:unnamed protein product [Amoebophrya sp. A120]|eukprot:GSA120T00021886001.1